MPEIAIIIPIWDSWEQSQFTIDFVEQMLSFVEGNFAVIIVDNASPSPITQDYLRQKKDPRFHVLYNNENLGYGRAANVGIRYAVDTLGATYLMVLNNDVIVMSPDWLESAFLSYLREHKNCMMGARLIDFNTATAYDGVNVIPYLEGWCMVAHKDVWIDLDWGFSPDLFLFHEDVEICIRAVKQGYELKQSDAFHWKDWYHCENPPLHHLYGRTGYAILDRQTIDGITETSRQYVVDKHFGNKEKDAPIPTPN